MIGQLGLPPNKFKTGLRNSFQSLKSGLKKIPELLHSLTLNARLRWAIVVIRGTASNTANAAITWAPIVTGGHGNIGFSSTVTTDGNGDIILTLSPIGKVISFMVTLDESYAAFGLFAGATDNGDGTISIRLFYDLGNHTGTLVGNATNWTLTNMGSFNVVSNTVSGILFNPPKPYGNSGSNGQNLNYWTNATARYVGTGTGLSIQRTRCYCGLWDASGNTYPNTGGSGAAGAIMKGDVFYFSNGGTLNSTSYAAGDSVTSLTDSPGQTNANWQLDVGGGPVFGYQLVTNATGIAVITNSSTDIIELITSTPNFIQINAATNDANGFPGSTFHTASTNLWIQAIIQV